MRSAAELEMQISIMNSMISRLTSKEASYESQKTMLYAVRHELEDLLESLERDAAKNLSVIVRLRGVLWALDHNFT